MEIQNLNSKSNNFTKEVLLVDSLEKCKEACFNEKSFYCLSIDFILLETSNNCYLYDLYIDKYSANGLGSGKEPTSPIDIPVGLFTHSER